MRRMNVDSRAERFPEAVRSSLSDASILQQAASAVAEVASSKPVESAVARSDHFHIVARLR